MIHRLLFALSSMTLLAVSLTITIDVLAQYEEKMVGTSKCDLYNDTDRNKFGRFTRRDRNA